MNSEQIKAELKDIEAQVNAINQRRTELIKSLCKVSTLESGMSVGDIVSVNGENGIFGGYEYRYGLDMVIYKMKKDGTASKNKMWVFYGADIKLVSRRSPAPTN